MNPTPVSGIRHDVLHCLHRPLRWQIGSRILAIVCALTAPAATGFASGTKAKTSKLWTQYAEAKRTGKEPILADFSFAGYHAGEKAIPDVSWEVFDVTRFGAKPNDGKSDRAGIIAAIAAAEKNGSGVILFPKGRYHINQASDPHNTPIVIESSRIVLRGAGAGPGGTELFMERHMDPTDPKKLWSSPNMIQFKGKGQVGKKAPVVANARRETHAVEIDDASSFQPGQWIVLSLRNNSPEVVAAAVAPYKPEPAWTSLLNNGVNINEFHLIESVAGNRLVFKTPIHANVSAKEGWTVQRIDPLEEVGVEDIAFTGNWKEAFIHHKNAIHDGGWSMLGLNRCVNSWVRRCRFTDVNRVVSVSQSSALTLEDLIYEGNGGHNAVMLQSSSHCLVQRTDDRAGHWHSGGVAGASTGNVFLRGRYPATTCFEAHASQPRWNLFDNISGGWMYGRWGGSAGNQPNHLHGLVLWNYQNTGKGTPDPFHFMVPKNAYGRIIMPYVIGFHGNPQKWVEKEIAVLESNGAPVEPRSLYEAQLALRTKK